MYSIKFYEKFTVVLKWNLCSREKKKIKCPAFRNFQMFFEEVSVQLVGSLLFSDGKH